MNIKKWHFRLLYNRRAIFAENKISACTRWRLRIAYRPCRSVQSTDPLCRLSMAMYRLDQCANCFQVFSHL